MTTSSLKQFREEIGKASLYSGLVTQFKEGNDEARDNLESLINKELPGNPVNVRTEDSLIARFGLRFGRRYDRLATEIFADNSESIIDEAKRKNKDKFAEAYLSVPAVKTGDAEFDSIHKLHKNYQELANAVSELENSDKTLSLAKFVEKTKKIIEEDLKRLYPNDKEGIVKLVIATYLTSSPQEAKSVASAVAGRIREEIEQALPENQRANYTAALLYKHSKDKKGAKIARDIVYQLSE